MPSNFPLRTVAKLLFIFSGKNYFMWLGPTPRLNITDPKLIKEVLSNYEVFQKPEIIKLLLTGIVVADGEKWAKYRKLVNPAFQLEKLKVISHASQLPLNFGKLIKKEG